MLLLVLIVVSLDIWQCRFYVFKVKFWSKSSRIYLHIIIFNKIGDLCVREMVDLSGHSVAITSRCTMKLERYSEIRTHGIQFRKQILEMVFQFLK